MDEEATTVSRNELLGDLDKLWRVLKANDATGLGSTPPYNTIQVPELGTVTCVAETGDSQLDSGANDEHYKVFQVEGDERLFMLMGTWVSHDGMYWDDSLSVVNRQIKTVTDFVWING